jgi:hypothetical protein
MLRLRALFYVLPALLVMLACGAARLSEITITDRPATLGAIAELQRNADAAHCAYDQRESTPAVAVFQCENDLDVRFANIDGRLAYACTDTTEARCQEAAAPLLGVVEGAGAEATDTTEPMPVAETTPVP